MNPNISLKGRSFLKMLDFSKEEISYLLDLSAKLKEDKKEGSEKPLLSGKNFALIFEKTSTRTRCAFEVAAHDQGAHVTHLDSNGSQIGKKESIKDTSRVLGRMFDAIGYRGFKQTRVEQLSEESGVPVWNGLTDESHPTQVLADLLTMKEHCQKPLERISYAYIGDARFNMGNSLLVGGAKMGMDVRIVAPVSLQPDPQLVQTCQQIATESNARITITDDIEKGIKGCDFILTDIWVSMGEPQELWEERIQALLPYQVNRSLMEKTLNPECKFMHCLPSYHNRETEIGEEIFKRFGIDGVEVTEEVFEGPSSIVFDEAENRLHTIKAVMVATLYDNL